MVSAMAKQAQYTEPGAAVPWPPDWDEIVLRLLASGLVELADRVESGQPVRLPYPVSLQRGLDRLSVMCLAAGTSSPRSIADLLRWCARPLGDWEFRLAADGADDSVRLIVGGYPSRDCQEWVVVSADVEGEFREQQIVFDALDLCRAHNRPDVYVAFRELLITKPAMSELEHATELTRSELALVVPQLQRAYGAAPPEALIGGAARVCAHCRNLLLPGPFGEPQCAESDCTKATRILQTLAADEGVRWVGREIRTWVCAPGRAEVRIRDRLAKAGVTIDLWPEFDSADLKITFPDGKFWFADVKTWSGPVQLARRLKRRPFCPPEGAEQSFIVIGKHQTAARRGYMDTLRSRNPSLKTGPIRAVTEAAFITAVIDRQGGVGRA
jgi:hypothetical protein